MAFVIHTLGSQMSYLSPSECSVEHVTNGFIGLYISYLNRELSILVQNSGNTKESQNMVTPAMQLAHKIPDINVQLWATALLRDLYQSCGDGQRAQVSRRSVHLF